MLDKKIVDGLLDRAKKGDSSVLRSAELKSLFDQIKTLPADKRKEFGQSVNTLRAQLEQLLEQSHEEAAKPEPIDVTSPMDINSEIPKPGRSSDGSIHPLTAEISKILDIYGRMGFSAQESRQLDDDWHMFTSLNFPENHPARDEYDSFNTKEGFRPPPHTSTMQNRILKANKNLLKTGKPIAYVIPGRCFRNEDVDARHDHTFNQLEGIYVDKGVHAGMLIATLQTFFEEYFGKKMEVKTQPFYFPFTEPSFEFAIACPFCDKAGCSICGEGWMEMLGCGMIHPNVLKMAGIDPKIYTGFAWGGGIERLVMIKHEIEDIRNFHSGNLKFLRQF
jgi:phenylalanyl-tRNA synthetase alpha chain